MLIDAIALKLVQKLLDENIIKFDDWDVYMSGLQLLISGIFKFLGFMMIAFFLDSVPEAVAFLAAFAFIRIFAGGYHLKSYLACFITTGIFMVGSILVGQAWLVNTSILYTAAILAAAFMLILIYAPIDHANRKSSHKEYRLNRKKSIAAILLLSAVIFILFLINQRWIVFCNIAAIAAFLGCITLTPIFASRRTIYHRT